MADRKVKQQKEIEQLSPEALEKEIENNKRKIVQSIVFIAAAAIALIAICMAWFVSNSRVNGTLVTVSAKYSGIEIGSEGRAGVHDDFWQTIKKVTSYFPTIKEEYDTSSGGSINWMLNESSNMKNYAKGKSFKETGAIYRKDYAIEPRTKGKLDFFIKTYEDGDFSLDFSFEISPFHVESGDGTPILVRNDTVEAGLLSGHILYFLGEKQPDGKIKYTWIKNGKFKIDIQEAKKDIKYNYSIYWVWPLNLSTILLNTGDSFLNGSTVEFDDKDSTGTLRNNIVTDMEKHPNKYFFSSLTGQPLDTNYAEVKEISNIHKNSGKNEANTYDKQLFVDLSSYYNQADMKIGSGISFVTATLKYLGTSETTNETTEAQNER